MHNFFYKYKQVVFFASLVISISYLLLACQKEVHIDLGSTPPVIVVEGQIETGQPPFVVLTSTVSFFSTIDLSTLEGSFIHNAVVSVSNGVKTITLKEYTIDTGINNRFYIYSIDTSNFANLMIGEVGRFYTLKIVYSNNTYTSVTKIANPKGVDTMWFAKPLYPRKTTPDSARQLFVNYTDPDTLGNFVRCFSKRNSDKYYPDGLFSDQAVNGIRIPNIALFAGYEDSLNVKSDTLRYFYPGDTVTLKWCQIDKAVYNFWNTENYASQTLGDPFASPINLQTNIKGGAIGVWAGYSSFIKTLVVPHQ